VDVDHNGLQVFGFRIKDFTYLTDVKTISEPELNKVKNSKVLVVNALREKPHHSHFNLEEALAFIELAQPQKAYLTHISHHMGFHEEIQKKLPKNVYLAYDNLVVDV
jgi:phosphoribosyl 1,2-cyclic phosphate phosphodiesterase